MSVASYRAKVNHSFAGMMVNLGLCSYEQALGEANGFIWANGSTYVNEKAYLLARRIGAGFTLTRQQRTTVYRAFCDAVDLHGKI